MRITKKQRDKLHNKYGGKCAYCGEKLPKRWHADHIEPVHRTWEFTGKSWDSSIRYTGCNNPELDNFDNLNPSCPECNMKKGMFTIEQFRNDLSLQVERLQRDSKNFRFALKYKQIELTAQPIIFYFETLQLGDTYE